MPVWENMTRDIRHMLTFHEIAHALFTPFEEWAQACEKHGASLRVYVNIVEDARIERMIKSKFPGIRRDFLDGYRKLHGRDLFEIDGQDIAGLSIGDRINLHYKIGFVESIPFATGEQIWIDRIDAAKTFTDVIAIALDLRAAMKDEKKNEDSNDSEDSESCPTSEDVEQSDESADDGGQSTPADEDGGEGQDDGAGKGGSEDSSDAGTNGDDSGQSSDDDTDDGESAESNSVSTRDAGENAGDISTQEAFDRNLSNESGDSLNNDYLYRDLPEGDLDKIVIDFVECHKRLAGNFDLWTQRSPEKAQNFLHDAGKFINGSSKTVNQMAQQFEMKKRADVDRTTKVSSTGELNMEELVNYKFTEDIFLRAEETPDGKNHGLVVLVDWSGSMCNCMEQTIEQMVQLVLFCKKVQIPFEVYAFTNNEFGKRSYNDDATNNIKWKNAAEGEEIFGNNFQLLNLMSSRMNILQYKAGLKHMMMLAMENGPRSYGSGIPCDWSFALSGTPLDEAIACMNQIIPQFRSQNDLNVVNLTILTDGHSNTGRWFEMDQADGERLTGLPILRNKKNGGQYAAADRWAGGMTAALLDYTRDNTGVNIIGIFLESSKATRVAYNLCGRYDDLQKLGYDEVFKQYKNDGFVSTSCAGYDEYFIVAGTTKVEQTSLADLDEDASMARIKSAFLKGVKNTRTSRVLLNRMIDHLA